MGVHTSCILLFIEFSMHDQIIPEAYYFKNSLWNFEENLVK